MMTYRTRRDLHTPVLWPAVALLVLTCGCSAFGGPHARDPEYSAGFYNATAHELTGVHITWEANHVPYRMGTGILIPRAEKESHSGPDPIPPKVTVHWTTDDGKEHTLDVEVASKVADLKGFTGTIWFKFTPAGGVEVIPMSEAEKEDRVNHDKRATPD